MKKEFEEDVDPKPRRPYHMSKRAQSVAQTEHNIHQAAVLLCHERSIEDITLADIAKRAGVSARTVIRRYGSKESLFKKITRESHRSMISTRECARVGDVQDAVQQLLHDYENHGDAMIRTQNMEQQLDIARDLLETGRDQHRIWCGRIFGPFLPYKSAEHYATALNAIVAATDILIWKLLRRDMACHIDSVTKTFEFLADGLIKPAKSKITQIGRQPENKSNNPKD